MTQELREALAKLEGQKMPLAELDAQRISFAYGNAPANDKGTKESVRRSLRQGELA